VHDPARKRFVANAEPSASQEDKRARGQWARLRRPLKGLLVAVVLGLAGYLLSRTLGRYDLDQVIASVTSIPLHNLGLAGGFAAASYLCLTGFDALAVRYVGRPLPYRRVATASFVALSIGHNIGFAALSSGAIRYRFYARWGLSAEEVAKLILFCALTVALGLTILGGMALLLRPDLAAEITRLDRPLIFALGTTCLALAVMYLVLTGCVRHALRFRRWTLEIPPLWLALGQVIIGPLNFACVAACLHQALAAMSDVAYVGVAAAYVIANVTALITHVPGGLGVIESVITFLLPQGDIIGALVVFRFVYFLVPLGIGSLLLAGIELARRRSVSKPEVPAG
jgi:uncharacterized membrane protein YbhN (UPF0104 family)